MERYGKAIGTLKEDVVLEEVFREMPGHNFSTDQLQQVFRQVAVIELRGVLWSDWGSPRRIMDTLFQIGKAPNFPVSCRAAG